jgi:hypothetical protein
MLDSKASKDHFLSDRKDQMVNRVGRVSMGHKEYRGFLVSRVRRDSWVNKVRPEGCRDFREIPALREHKVRLALTEFKALKAFRALMVLPEPKASTERPAFKESKELPELMALRVRKAHRGLTVFRVLRALTEFKAQQACRERKV